MASEHGERFNHDDQAADYDADVLRQSDPIRAGYGEALDWVARQAGQAQRILDLGAGTGNLTVRLPVGAEIAAVDLSAKMLDAARDKLVGRNVRYVQADLFDLAAHPDGPWDAIVSTYAVHHLVPDEKRRLLEGLCSVLAPGGRIAMADLMFEDPEGRVAVLAGLPAHVREDANDEFFWDVAATRRWLTTLGLQGSFERFSALTWGFVAHR